MVINLTIRLDFFWKLKSNVWSYLLSIKWTFKHLTNLSKFHFPSNTHLQPMIFWLKDVDTNVYVSLCMKAWYSSSIDAFQARFDNSYKIVFGAISNSIVRNRHSSWLPNFALSLYSMCAWTDCTYCVSCIKGSNGRSTTILIGWVKSWHVRDIELILEFVYQKDASSCHGVSIVSRLEEWEFE